MVTCSMNQTLRHATVARDGFDVPLIGIPVEAVLDECQLCGDVYPIRELAFSPAGQLLCSKCRKNHKSTEPKP